jgi:hypothetical protein
MEKELYRYIAEPHASFWWLRFQLRRLSYGTNAGLEPEPHQNLLPGAGVALKMMLLRNNVIATVYPPFFRWTSQRNFTLRHLKNFGFGSKSLSSSILDQAKSLVQVTLSSV